MIAPLLIQADARRLPLQDASVHCVVTSPPYWGLRDYGLRATVWGGDPDCRHAWGPALGRVRKPPRPDHSGGAGVVFDTYGTQPAAAAAAVDATTGTFCTRCGAWLGCLGLEPTPELFVAHLLEVFREAGRVLRGDGTLWVNIGDSYWSKPNGSIGATTIDGSRAHATEYRRTNALRKNRPTAAGLKHKDRVGIPHMLAFALRADGWYWRDEVVWAKPNPMPESVRDRTTKAHEFLFMFSKSPAYFYDADAIREPCVSMGGAGFGNVDRAAAAHAGGAQARRITRQDRERYVAVGRNKRSVWTIATKSCPEAHFATFPVDLPGYCIQAGTSARGCCRACGAPWRRVTDRVGTGWDGSKYGERAVAASGGAVTGGTARSTLGSPNGRLVGQRLTTAWVPACRCDAGEPVPCTVLDSFGGAMTTGLAAQQLGRRFVGSELKADYIDIGRRRLARASTAATSKRRRRPAAVGELTLFKEG